MEVSSYAEGRHPHVVIFDAERLISGAKDSILAEGWIDEHEVESDEGWQLTGEWEMLQAEAHPGWGPLLYDVTSSAFGVVLVPSPILTQNSRRFWHHQNQLGSQGRKVVPLSEAQFAVKYRVTLADLMKRFPIEALPKLWRALRKGFRGRRVR